MIRRWLENHGTLLALAALCLYFTIATYRPDYPTGAEAAAAVEPELVGAVRPGSRVAVVSREDESESAFATELVARLGARGFSDVLVARGDPPTVRSALEKAAREGPAIAAVAATRACAEWAIWEPLRESDPSLSDLRVVTPSGRWRSAFLSPANLRNIADQIAVIAIIAAGMTLVILTGGIDLSVGSLVALSAVVTAWLVGRWGGAAAGPTALAGAAAVSVAACGAIGAFSGLMVVGCRIPPFIATLAMMQVASGIAFIVARGESIYDVPESFVWLGRGVFALGIPNAVVLMGAVYAVAHWLMRRSVGGRRIYAVGGNAEAARLSGVPVARVLLTVYVLCGLMAGVGGVVTASQLKAGAPTYGVMYELYVIAAVVVGGTSLSGGEGRVLGTLVGAFLIAVIRNGMNLVGVESYTQKVVLGSVILAAVLLDQWRRRHP